MNKQKVNNIVFFTEPLNIRAGGPSGYIANLKQAIEKEFGNKNIIFISKENLPFEQEISIDKKFKTYAKILTLFIPLKTQRKYYREKLIQKFSKTAPDYLKTDAIGYKEYAKILDNYDFKTITCHSVRDALFVRNYIKTRKLGAKLILMSHSPQPPSEEFYHTEKLNRNPYAKQLYKMWQNMEKKAFYSTDCFLFPTEESMEPYLNSLKYFTKLVKKKNIKFIPTGCKQIDLSNVNEDIRKKFNITTKYIIAYIGRHTKIKGYDILKDIAKEVLTQRDDVTFVIGGNQSKEIAPLDNERWIELGRINPADLLKVSDLFVLPNRQTYFDLILLEVLSSGVPVIASNTGGNKSVYRQTGSIALYNTKEDCVEKINHYLNQNDEYKINQKIEALSAYSNNYTLQNFAKNYMTVISEITKEMETK